MVKGEKRARRKRLIKKKESLLERAREHRIKAGTEPGRKDTTTAYWLGEAERFEEQAEDVQEMLNGLDKSEKDSRKE